MARTLTRSEQVARSIDLIERTFPDCDTFTADWLARQILDTRAIIATEDPR